MSKFFNETLKARNVVLPVDSPDITSIQDSEVTAEAPEEASPVKPATWLEQCRQLRVPSTCLLREQFKGSDWLESAEESYRSLRTRLMRMRDHRDLRSVILTSSVQGEGKTLTSANLAMSCSQLPDFRVLLVDSDLRNAGLSRLLGSPSAPGLSEVLMGQCSPEEAILATDNTNLYFLPASHSDGPPAELLANGKWTELMSKLHESFDLILVDAPPILNLADVELIAPACDGLVMVVRAGHVRREVLEKSAKQLDPKRFLGLVYNGADGAYYPRYYYGS